MAIIVNLDVMMAKRKISSGQLAEQIGITQANLSVLKTGKAKAVRFSTLEAICKAFHISLSEFFAEENEPLFLTPDQREHLSLWNRLDKNQQKLIEDFFKTIK